MGNLIGVIINKNEDGFYKFGTETGKLERLYARSQLLVCLEKFLSIEQVPNVPNLLSKLQLYKVMVLAKMYVHEKI